MKIFKRLAVLCVTLIIFISTSVTALAYNNIPYSTYAYNYEGAPVQSPHAYIPSLVFKCSDIGVTDLSSPSDMCLDNEDNIYIADTENARVVVVSSDFSSAKVISSFRYGENDYAFTRPTGLYVTDEGELYVADST